MELQEKINVALSFYESRNKWRNDFDSFQFQLCDELNKKLFGESLKRKVGCECLPIFFFKLKNISNEKIQQKTMGQFQLKKGKMIQMHGLSDVYTSDNITDEKAIAILKKCPAHIKTFEKYPENWSEIVFGVPAKKVEKPVTKKVEVEEIEEEASPVQSLKKKKKK